jgi:tRNA modification GTPase
MNVGLSDLIHAETEQQRRQALRQMDGGLFKQFEIWRNKLIKIVASFEGT